MDVCANLCIGQGLASFQKQKDTPCMLDLLQFVIMHGAKQTSAYNIFYFTMLNLYFRMEVDV
jgi:hypothetical protein